MNTIVTKIQEKRLSITDFSAVDLFCGVGGLTHGLISKGVCVSAGIDFDQTCGYAYEKNNPVKFIHEDVTRIKGEDLVNLYRTDRHHILVGCAPCQPFSNHSNRIREKRAEKAKDEPNEGDKWKLLYEFLRLVRETEPSIISMENVPQLRNHQIFDDFIFGLRELNYFVSDYKTPVFCPDYGIPQRRYRLVLLASKLGPIELIKPTFRKENYQTVEKAIGKNKLPKIAAGEVDANDPLHRARKLTPLNLKRIQSLKQGENWKSLHSDLISPCHKKEVGSTFTGAYGRMRWDEQAPTMTTHCVGFSNGRFGHPEQDRAISLREAALLQSFPVNYDFIESVEQVNTGALARHIGNAVPPKLGEAIAESIKNHVSQYSYE